MKKLIPLLLVIFLVGCTAPVPIPVPAPLTQGAELVTTLTAPLTEAAQATATAKAEEDEVTNIVAILEPTVATMLTIAGQLDGLHDFRVAMAPDCVNILAEVDNVFIQERRVNKVPVLIAVAVNGNSQLRINCAESVADEHGALLIVYHDDPIEDKIFTYGNLKIITRAEILTDLRSLLGIP